MSKALHELFTDRDPIDERLADVARRIGQIMTEDQEHNSDVMLRIRDVYYRAGFMVDSPEFEFDPSGNGVSR